MRTTSKIILFFLSSIGLFGTDIRDEVAVVTIEPGEEFVDVYTAMSEWTQTIGQIETSDRLLSMAQGSFGSGFLYRLESGELGLITNYHVVGGASSLEIVFQASDSPITAETEVSVLYTSPERDLALLGFPNTEELLGEGLSLFEDPNDIIVDGTEVWAAGFPGLAGRPSWQYSKGNITNRHLVLEEISKLNLPYFYQHSAVIDAGSSGGPLIMPRNGDESTVIGLNTLSARRRDSVYFAVPSVAILAFLDEYNTTMALDTETHLARTVDSFLASSRTEGDAVFGLYSYFSDGLSIGSGWSAYLFHRSKMDEEVRRGIEQDLFYGSTLVGLKELVAFSFIDQYPSEIPSYEIQEISENNAQIVFHDEENRPIETQWIFENGDWKLDAVDLSVGSGESMDEEVTEYSNENKRRNLAKTEFHKRWSLFPYIGGQYTHSKNTSSGFGFSLGFDYRRNFTRFFGLSLGLKIELAPRKETSIGAFGSGSTTNLSILIPVRVHLTIPILINNNMSMLMPSFSIGSGPRFGFSQGYGFFYIITAGLDYIFSESSGSLALELFYINTPGFDFNPLNAQQHQFGVRIGYRFRFG